VSALLYCNRYLTLYRDSRYCVSVLILLHRWVTSALFLTHELLGIQAIMTGLGAAPVGSPPVGEGFEYSRRSPRKA
jgi:hypothetical protein